MRIASTNPSKNYELVGEVDVSTHKDIQDAFNKAREAQPKWAELNQAERNNAIESLINICNEHDEEIARAVSREMGKPIAKTRLDIQVTADYLHGFMGSIETALKSEVVFENDTEKHTQVREPLGVLVCISPWNFPFFNIAFQFGQALLAGNAVLWKPSEEIIVYSKLIANFIMQSSIPDGVLTILFGDGKVGEQLVNLPIDGILFTGSTRTGQHVNEIASKHSRHVLTEMGGSSPGIIFEDADIKSIVGTAYAMRMTNSGQWCDGLKRLIVHESKYQEILDALNDVNATKKIGNALDEDTDIGPLVAKRQLDLLLLQVEDAVDKGAKVFFGGKQPSGLEGAYYEPTVLTNITFDMRVWQEEVFGPVLPIVTFKTEEEAIKLANDTTYGLTAFVFTPDKQKYLRVASKLQAGCIAHNNALYFSPNTPFGGYKGSGHGRVCGNEGFHEVTKVKVISEAKT